MNTQEALQQIRTAPLKSVYLVTGTEDYLVQEIRQAFLDRMKKDDLEELNFMSFDMEENGLGAVIDEAETLPFFGDYRLIFVENPYFLTGEKKSNVPDQDVDGLVDYLKQPLDTSILVFWANYPKLDARKKITKALKKTAVIEAAPLQERDLRNFLQRYISNENVKISKEAFDLFLRLTDFDLSKAMNEIEKLLLLAGEGGTITLQLVQDLVPKTLEHNIFELTEQILKGDTEKAYQTYEELHLQGEETIKLTAILIGQIRLLLQTKLLQKNGYQQANIAETLGVHPYRVKLAMQQVAKFPLNLLVSMYDELVENDYEVKTGQADKEMNFQLFILKTTEKIKK
ncbi:MULTISPECIES: DNA polymerase III subunit delta [Enterococcus]|uniref:DNA polymerase III subunit delta n=1 Tax=Enterococcus malodoratus ATCC 43197 TaxID=1158601 RepID=R2S3S6_9ENTE|nr:MULTISPECIES: DNA polymerase III subunit delta [Enterococcus]EOH82819.1 DNA polymerase III, delta subunit [Enterococcus malodoratus ATCC 43197]EOT70635.1 DNA polymerase III, delta subunit [Enterococcus malodoratus ATCC 43197]OJG57782.1 DNA polymerase III, delta subunit [Enterococcus malodoratus]SPW86618.1 DNA polymerase III, delta subunit [Enterococcus malodoratus]STC71955.1 DNA polymerase III, delta subunit [Enterococcus malodoratus]